MKRSKEIPPASAEPWNTDVTETVAPPTIDEAPAAGVADAPPVELIPVTADIPLTIPPVERTGEPAPDRSSQRRNIRHAALAAGGLVALIIVTAVTVAVTLGGIGGGDTTPHAIAPEPDITSSNTTSAASPVDPNADCPSATKDNVTTGRDAGDYSSGPGVIKKYDYAFYVTRSGDQARDTGAPTANMGTPQAIQTTIDQTPTGTRHCLRIVDSGSGLFDVTLTETPPGGGTPTIYQQRFQTTVIGGRTLIAQNLLNVRIS
ncbi:hypothetical protein [Williamsia sp. CHRR-6]|uniref:hypothetical protein n=1 Tax=Williamsia sp. CHRR-6 TaxID=2835871 RepID=UPI001BDA283D|nr:hypothetical protein [Williamsia sp. CHRR-6]MBT0568602.1 hypothetical protein [Williamsia sp. CHRR-6]